MAHLASKLRGKKKRTLSFVGGSYVYFDQHVDKLSFEE